MLTARNAVRRLETETLPVPLPLATAAALAAVTVTAHVPEASPVCVTEAFAVVTENVLPPGPVPDTL